MVIPMAEPIKATVIRSWNDVVVTAYWDLPKPPEGRWFVIRKFRADATPMEMRFNQNEVELLVKAIGIPLDSEVNSNHER
jgi:hypothetical protein